MQPCCEGTVDKWYRSFLAARGGIHSVALSRYFEFSARQLAPLFAELLGSIVYFRVAASKSIEKAFVQQLACPKCHSSCYIVVVGSPLMLLIFRLQSIFMSMVDAWEIDPSSKSRIHFNDAGPEQLKQLNMALDSYLGKRDISLSGVDELVAGIDRSPPIVRKTFLNAVSVGEAWIVAHEVSHVVLNSRCVLNRFCAIAKIASDYASQIASHFSLEKSNAVRWSDELQADLVACDFLLIAITDHRFSPTAQEDISPSDARFFSGYLMANGIAAALEAMFWMDVHANNRHAGEGRLMTHPPLDIRWQLLSKYLTQVVLPQPGSNLLGCAELIALLSENLRIAYGR